MTPFGNAVSVTSLSGLLLHQQDNRILVFSKSSLNGTARRWNPRHAARLLDQCSGFRFGQQRSSTTLAAALSLQQQPCWRLFSWSVV